MARSNDNETCYACRHLMTKAMTISGGRAPFDPDPLNEQVMDVGYAWCSRTLEAVGPDDRPVLSDECTSLPGRFARQRRCFERGPRR